MSLKHLVIVAILGSSSVALADDSSRKWTIHAARMYVENGNVENKPAVSDPGVFVTAKRDPHQKHATTTSSTTTSTSTTTTTAQQ